MLAHELRNPLSAISGAVRLFQDGKLGDQDFAWGTDVIARQVKQLCGIIDDLLDVSRITQGKIQLRREDIDLRPIIDHAVEVVGPLVEERKHRLIVSSTPAALRLHADPTRVEQILVNLLTNAAKYTESGGRICLTAEQEGSQVIITVQDNGIGIPPEMLPRMFELFAQGDRSLARSEGGLGIGLTLVRKLVEMHGGSIVAHSEGPATGSTFTVRLPAAIPGPKEAPRREPAATTAVAEGSRVLVVDDNVDTARGMMRLLRVYGHEVRIAHSGPEAIEAALALRPQFILLDIGLPGMNRYEVVARLRGEGTCRDAVIVAISGYGQEEDRRRTQEAGFNHHLVKPIDHDALLTLLAAQIPR